jgi:hypothetical protein
MACNASLTLIKSRSSTAKLGAVVALWESLVSTILAAELSFDWAAYRSAYGEGTQCLAEIEQALRADDPWESQERLEGTLRFVCIDGVLSIAAPAYVATILQAIESKPSWSALSVLATLARATRTSNVPGHWPSPRVAHDQGLSGPAVRLARQDEQRRLAGRVRRVFTDARDLLLDAFSGRPEGDRLHSWSILAWAAVDGLDDAARRLKLLDSDSAGEECRELLFGSQAHPARTTQTLFATACSGVDATGLEDALECVANERHRESAIAGLEDFPWYDGSRSAALVALVAQSARSMSTKRRFLEMALDLSPTWPPDSPLLAPPTGATLAAWYLLSLHIGISSGPERILGPEDLDESRREVLGALLARHASWLLFAAQWLPTFGISDLRYLRDLLSQDLPCLRRTVTDVWAGNLCSQSVWKWIHQVGKDTPPGSAERLAATRVCVSVLRAHLEEEELSLVAAFSLERHDLHDIGQALQHQPHTY